MISVIRSQFLRDGIDGDFAFMIRQLIHAATLFVYNDNEEQFLSYFLDQSNPYGASLLHEESLPPRPDFDACAKGGGNAVIRPYQCAPHHRAIGVPTGSLQDDSPHYKGYSHLDQHVRTMVRYSMHQIAALLESGRFTALAFSYNPGTKLGGKIFDTALEVRSHIVEELERVTALF